MNDALPVVAVVNSTPDVVDMLRLSLEWAGFVVVSLIVGLLQGPGVTSIVGYALTAALRAALASVFGATLGNAIAMTLSLVGVGVLIEQWPAAFLIIKWVGAAYLIGMGLYSILTARAAV